MISAMVNIYVLNRPAEYQGRHTNAIVTDQENDIFESGETPMCLARIVEEDGKWFADKTTKQIELDARVVAMPKAMGKLLLGEEPQAPRVCEVIQMPLGKYLRQKDEVRRNYTPETLADTQIIPIQVDALAETAVAPLDTQNIDKYLE